MAIRLGQYISNLYADWDGFTNLDRDTIQRFLEDEYRVDSEEAQQKAETIQYIVSDGIVSADESKRLRQDLLPILGKKNYKTQLAPMLADNGQALWKNQFKYLRDHYAMARIGDTYQVDRLPGNATIQGVPIHSNQGPIVFHASGRLAKGVLRESTWIGEYAFKSDTAIELADDGRVVSGTVSGTYTDDRGTIPNGSEVQFDSRGQMISAILGEKANIQRFSFPKGSHVVFREDGSLFEVTLSRKTKIGQTFHKSGETLRFDEDSDPIAGS